MRSDIDRWNDKYSNHSATTDIRPEPLLVNNASLLSRKGNALDLASGICDNALYLASLGYNSFAVDGSHTALRFGKQKAAANNLPLHCFVTDLDTYPLVEGYFDVVVVIKYLNRSLVNSIKSAVKQDGLLLFKTFNQRFLDEKPSFSEDYVLNDGELSGWFLDWECVETNDRKSNRSTQSYWLGRKS